MSRIQRLASETAIYGASSVVGRLINFALVPIYVKAFPPEEYGVVGLVFTAVVFFNILFAHGMESAYLKYASGREGRARVQSVFSTVIWSLSLTSVGLVLLVLLVQDPLSTLLRLPPGGFELVYLALTFVVLDTLAVVPFAELRLQNRPWRFATIKLVSIVVNVALNFVLIFGVKMGIEAIFVAGIIASSTAVVLLLPTYIRHLRPRFDAAIWKSLLRFGLPFVPSGLAYVLAERANLFFFGLMGRTRILELYGDEIDTDALALKAEAARRAVAETSGGALTDLELAARMVEAVDDVYIQYITGVFYGIIKLSIAMMLFAQMFRFAWQPFFLQHAGDSDARALFARVFSLFTAAALFIFLSVSFFAYEIVSLPLPWLGHLIQPEYWIALNVVPVMLLAYVLQGWYYNFSVGVYVEKKTKYLVHCTVVACVVSLSVNALFVPRFGMIAAAWAVLAAFAAMAATLFVLSRRFYAVPYDWPRVSVLVAWTGVLFTVWLVFSPLQRWWIEGLLLILFGVVAWWMVPKPSSLTSGPQTDPEAVHRR